MVDRRTIVTALGAMATSVTSVAAETRGNRTYADHRATREVIYADDYAIDPTGVTDSAPALNLAIQDAIIQRKKLVLPTGIFLLNNPLLCFTPGVAGQTRIEIEGQGGALPGNQKFATLPLNRHLSGWMPNTVLCANFVDRPAVIFQLNRNSILRNLGIQGKNTTPFYSPTIPTDNAADYILAGCPVGHQSPYCGIAIDPFTASLPADGGYAGMGSYYGTGPAGSGSSGIQFENVYIQEFVVGVALSTAGVSQGDLIIFKNTQINFCDTGLVCGNSQSRNWIFKQGSIAWCRQGFDTINYGAGAGMPANPSVIEDSIFGEIYRIFALNNQSPTTVRSCYAESIKTLGQFGKNIGGSPCPITFQGNQWSIRDTWGNIPPLFFESLSPTVFKGDYIGGDSSGVGRDVWNIVCWGGQGGGGSFEQCTFMGPPILDLPPYIGIDFNARCGSQLVDCLSTSGTGTFQITDVFNRSNGIAYIANGKGRLRATWQTRTVTDGNLTYNYQPPLPVPYVVCNCDASSISISGTTLTFTESILGEVQIKDILIWKMLRQGYSGNQWIVPAWKVTAVNRETRTCTATALYDIAQYDTVANTMAATFGGQRVGILVHQWAPTQAVTGTTHTDETLTAVTPAALINGDWVSGAGIPANTRVVSGGGTASLVLSKATTASAAGVTLYYGRLLVPMMTVAF